MERTIFHKWQHKAVMPPGHWRSTKRDGAAIMKIACSLCGVEGDLSEHSVNENGGVTPSVICPNDCGFHGLAVLVNS